MKLSTGWKATILVFIIIVLDQILKIWVKTNMHYGQYFTIFEDWFLIYFVENPGMAFGWKFGGKTGKLLLSLFRLAAIGLFIWYLTTLIKQRAPQGFILCVSLILAGAIGNMIDSAFYGLIFDTGTVFNAELGRYVEYSGVSKFASDGYAPFLHGCVVDMFSFPIIKGFYPDWFPLMGGRRFVFFGPIFNIADAAVTSGIFAILIFYWNYLKMVNNG